MKNNFVIHLPERTDRFDRMFANLNYFCGVNNWEVVEGCVNKNPVFGCSQSFRKIVSMAKEKIACDDVRLMTSRLNAMI